MEANYCRGCLKKYEPVELFQYTEKSRRLFVYSTGVQVKRNDAFAFQLCKECCINMKVACNFKKTCRNSDKKLKSYLQSKESGDNTDLDIFLKNNEDTFKFRLPMNSTPAYHINKDDDNESTCTSIQNFMTDILRAEEIPDSEARIICEVIEEEADILDDSLDSHWLQEDVSVDSDFKMDFTFSPFSTPRSVNNDGFYCPKKFNDRDDQNNKINDVYVETKDENHTCFNKPIVEFNLNEILTKEIHLTKDIEEQKCVIDANLENVLKNDTADKVMLDDILLTPPVLPNISCPPTPEINNILFGDKLNEDSRQELVNSESNICQEDIEVLDEFLKVNNSKQKSVDIEFDDSLIDIEEIENVQNYFNKNTQKKKKNINVKNIKRSSSPIENKCCITNFYCKMCKRQFKNLVALKVHCTKYHKLKIEKPQTKRIRKKYICDYCGQLFKSSRCIVKHLANHQNDTHKCEKCSLKFSSVAAYKKHLWNHTGIRTKKDNENNYVCNTCGAVCSSSSNFYIHIRRHLNNYTHNCEICGKGFYRNSDLNQHMRYHTGEKPYGCHSCQKRFIRRDALSRHILMRHTEDKPFSCQFCDSKYSKSYELKAHQKISKRCLKQQELIAEEGTEDMQKILITEALVF